MQDSEYQPVRLSRPSGWFIAGVALAWLAVLAWWAEDAWSLTLRWGGTLLLGYAIWHYMVARASATEPHRGTAQPRAAPDVESPTASGPRLRPQPTDKQHTATVGYGKEDPKVDSYATDVVGLDPTDEHASELTPAVLTAEEVAKVLRVEKPVVLGALHDGLLPGNQIGGQWRVSRAALLRWLDGSYTGP